MAIRTKVPVDKQAADTTGGPSAVPQLRADQMDSTFDVSDTFKQGLDVLGIGPGSPADRARNASSRKLTINDAELA